MTGSRWVQFPLSSPSREVNVNMRVPLSARRDRVLIHQLCPGANGRIHDVQLCGWGLKGPFEYGFPCASVRGQSCALLRLSIRSPVRSKKSEPSFLSSVVLWSGVSTQMNLWKVLGRRYWDVEVCLRIFVDYRLVREW